MSKYILRATIVDDSSDGKKESRRQPGVLCVEFDPPLFELQLGSQLVLCIRDARSYNGVSNDGRKGSNGAKVSAEAVRMSEIQVFTNYGTSAAVDSQRLQGSWDPTAVQSVACVDPNTTSGRASSNIRHKDHFRASAWTEPISVGQPGGGFAVWLVGPGLRTGFRPDASQGYERLFAGAARFCVLPKITPGPGQPDIAPDALCMQTVVSRCLGPVNQWPSALAPTLNAGFNAIHFTPVLARGSSNSSYSQLSHVIVARQFFQPPVPPCERFRLLKETMDRLGSEHGVLCIGDLVLNHVASNAPFLMAHGLDGTFSPCNTPALGTAVAVDDAITELSRALQTEASLLRTAADIDRAVDRLRHEFLPAQCLWEFYVLDVDECVLALAPLLLVDGDRQPAAPADDLKDVVESLIIESGECRFPWTIDKDAVRRRTGPGGDLASVRVSRGALVAALNRVNAPWYAEFDDDVNAICSNVAAQAKYMRLDPDGPMLSAQVSVDNCEPLVTPYFIHTPQLPGDAAQRADAAEQADPFAEVNPYQHEFDQIEDAAASLPVLPLACNGWLFGASPGYDDDAVCSIDCRAYRRREMVIWGDTVKLRYGRAPSDSPYLWERAAVYGRTMATVFGGVRLDNAHSTPLAVAIHALAAGRVVRPHLWVAAEWFSGSEHADAVAASALGASALVREAANANDAATLARYCWENGRRQQPLVVKKKGGVAASAVAQRHRFATPYQTDIARSLQATSSAAEEEAGELLLSFLQPAGLFCDLTHDNETAVQKRAPGHALATAALVAMAAGGPLGSVRGADELVPKIRHLVAIRSPPRYRNDDMQLDADRALWPGFSAARPLLNWLHRLWTEEPFASSARTEPYGFGRDIVVVTRRCPGVGSFTMIARCAFNSTDGHGSCPPPDPLCLPHWSPLETDQPEIVAAALLDTSRELIEQAIGKAHRTTLMSRKSSKLLITEEHLLDHGPADCLRWVCAIDQAILFPNGGGGAVAHRADGHSDSSDAQCRKPQWPLPDGEYRPLSGHDTGPFVSHFSEDGRTIHFGPKFRPGSFVLLWAPVNDGISAEDRTQLSEEMKVPGSFKDICQATDESSLMAGSSSSASNSSGKAKVGGGQAGQRARNQNRLVRLATEMSLCNLNQVLYMCEEEERGRSGGQLGVYVLHGEPLPYAGLAGVGWALLARRSVLKRHLDEGDWLWHYVVDRLLWEDQNNTGVSQALAAWAEEAFKLANLLRTQQQHQERVDQFGWWIACLLRSIHFGAVRLLSAELPPAMCSGARSLVSLLTCRGTLQHFGLGGAGRRYGSLAAGLPHFAHGWTRNWGRDTLMSMRGLLMRTGQWEQSLRLLARFGRVVRHGLIPNLLEGGRGGDESRYNARDAAWWWLLAMRDFDRLAPAYWANRLLTTRVQLRWGNAPDNPIDDVLQSVSANDPGVGPDDDDEDDDDGSTLVDDDELGRSEGPWVTLAAIVQLIVQAHASGISFRERGAGPGLDDRMADAGFQVDAWLDPETGLVYGGNEHNAGTWMDKMGESRAAGNFGRPATARDGAAVELQAMAYTTACWLRDAHDNQGGRYPWAGFRLKGSGGQLVRWGEWARRLEQHFEPAFWVPADPVDDSAWPQVRPDLVHRRAMLKDSVGTTAGHADYQLRPNALVVLAEAPELLRADRARQALVTIERWLVPVASADGRKNQPLPLGVRTLDPNDWQYRGDYDQGNESNDPAVARGFNYHQGPEWLWPYGFFVKAQARLFHVSGQDRANLLAGHYRDYLADVIANPWLGLPELTNSNGASCFFSCATQAWSFATLIDAMFDD